MGGSTQAHAGFPIKGKDLSKILPKQNGSIFYKGETWDDGLCGLVEIIAEELGAVVREVGHMEDSTFILSPKTSERRNPFSVDLWCDKENYIKLSDINKYRPEINLLELKLKQFGFNPEFVIHPEWIE